MVKRYLLIVSLFSIAIACKSPSGERNESSLQGTDSITTVDLSADTARHVIIARGTEDIYQGHPTTELLPDGKTMYCVWTYNHGGPCGPLKRSEDGGRTWSPLLDVPDNWTTVRNCPTMYRLTNPQGVPRLFVFAGEGPKGGMYQSHSTDEGRTCTAMEG